MIFPATGSPTLDMLRLEAAAKRGARIIVIDPRHTGKSWYRRSGLCIGSKGHHRQHVWQYFVNLMHATLSSHFPHELYIHPKY